MPSSDKMTKAMVQQLAAEGRLVSACFDTFQAAVYPTAPPKVVDEMRRCFFAGAAELYALMLVTLDEGDDASPADDALMDSWVGEITAFHETTIAELHAAERQAGRGQYDA